MDIHEGQWRQDCVAVRVPTEDGSGEEICVARLLMLFSGVFQGERVKLAYIWWFTEYAGEAPCTHEHLWGMMGACAGGADATGCLVYQRSWQLRNAGCC